jgi:hypothetical protein
MESTVRPTPSIIEAGYRVGCWIGTKANKPLIVRCATANEEPQHRIEYYYLHLTDMDSNAIKIILNDHATHLTVVTYLGEYASLLLTQDLVSALPTTYMDTMLIDKFVPEVHKGNEQIISIETPYLARAVDGRVVTITYVNPGLTVGDICEVAAGSIGNQLLLSQRTAVQVCAENAPTVEAVADHADAIEVDDDPSDTVPETDTDEVVPEPNTTNHNGTVPNA